MAVNVGVNLNPNTRKVEAALARIQAQARNIDFGGGASSISKLSRPLGKITGQASEFQKSLEASNARVLAFGASVAVINKLSQAFGALVANTVKVEATFAKINTILGGTERQLQKFGNGIFKVAQATATSFDQVAEGALELARQGLSVEESLSRVETALKLVRVAGIDSEQAVAGLTAAIKGFEGAGLTVAAIADKLAEVDTKFAVSTEDLINGLERASASARVAGVSFDELLGVITTVQERTQRGGAVIGNAFKTIFARLGRTDTLVALEDLGISVLDSSGNVRSAIPLFEELAVELNKLGLKSVEAGDIIQKVAGVRQRDILISLVEDLNSGQSQFAKSLQVSAGAAGALDAKNQKLNETLEALINNLLVGAQKLSAVMGDLGFSDAAKDILKVFSSVVNGITDLLQGDSIGSKFAQGIVKGIGGVLTGPGLALISAIFVKLFVDLTKFGATSLKSLLGINKAAEAQGILQQSVLQTLLQNEAIQKEILALEGNKVAQEQLLLKIYNQQAAALARVQKAAAIVTPGLFGAGLRGGESGVAPRGRTGRGASGYVAAEARDVSRGVGGAPASSKVVSIPNFAFGGGQHGTMVANTSEYFVPNYAGGGDAIFNRDMVRTMGLPSGAKKINASNGYVPNFARPRSLERLRGLEKQKGPEAAAAKAELARRKRESSKQKLIYDPRFAMIVPRVLGPAQQVQGKRKGKKVAFDLVGYEPGVGSRVRNDEQLDSATRKFALGMANQEAKKMGGPPRADKISKLANTGAISALSGTIFETAVSSLLNSKDFDSRGETSTFDFIGGGANAKLRKLFPQLNPAATNIEAKIRLGPDTRKSMFDKILKSTGNAASGYIPNFADGGLQEAIEREKAAGLPISQIRINQSGKLRNASNPLGLAVTNTRDEPTGRIPNFAQRPGGSSRNGSGGGALAASTGLFFLSSALSTAESGIGRFVSEIAFAASALTSLTLLKGPLESVGSKLSNFGTELATYRSPITGGIMKGSEGKLKGARGSLGRGLAGVGRALPGIGAAVAVGAVVAPLVLELTKTKTGFEKLNEELKNIDLGELASGSKEASAALKRSFESQLKRIAEREKLASDLGVEGGANVEKIIEKQLSGLTGVQRTLFGNVKDRETLSASLAKLSGSGASLQDIIDQSQKTVTKTFTNEYRGTTRTTKELQFDPSAFAENMIKAIDEIDAAAKKLAETALKTNAGFGDDAFTGGKARKDFKENLNAGRFAAGGFNTVKQLEPSKPGEIGAVIIQEGALADIRRQNFDLAKATSTERKVDLENSIADAELQIELEKERFKITEEYVKSIKDTNVFSAEQKKLIEEQVEAGAGLLAIQDKLLEAGLELKGDALTTFELAVKTANLKERELENKKEDVELQKQINNLQKPQGFKEGLSKGLGELRNEIDFFEDKLGESIPGLFSDNLSTAMKDVISGAKDLEDALLGAGASFAQSMADAFIDQAARQATSSLMGGFQSLTSNIGGGGSQGLTGAAASAAAGKASSAASSGGKGGIMGFIGGIFGGGKKAAAPGSTATNPLFVQDVSNMVTNGGKEGVAAEVQKAIGGEGGEKGFLGGLKDTFSNLFGGLTEKFGSIFSSLKQGLMGLFSGGSGGGGGGIGSLISTGLNFLTGGFGFFANGGPVGFANGGSVGSTDTVPAMLTPGEFVVKKSAVNKYGTDFLSSLNSGLLPMQGFQNGGAVTPVSSEAASAVGSSSVTNNSEFSFNIEGGSATQNDQGGQEGSQREFAERVRLAVTTVIHEESRTGGSLSYLKG